MTIWVLQVRAPLCKAIDKSVHITTANGAFRRFCWRCFVWVLEQQYIMLATKGQENVVTKKNAL